MDVNQLESIALWAEIIGAGTILTAVVFGVFQVHQFRIQQRNAVATEIMQSFYNRDLAHAVFLVRQFPDGVSAEELRAKGADYEEAAIVVAMTLETMGLLMFKRIAPYDLVFDLVGGLAPVMWRKLSVWAETVRTEQDHPTWAEWFQWLAQTTEERKVSSNPAFIEHKDWKPEQTGRGRP